MLQLWGLFTLCLVFFPIPTSFYSPNLHRFPSPGSVLSLGSCRSYQKRHPMAYPLSSVSLKNVAISQVLSGRASVNRGCIRAVSSPSSRKEHAPCDPKHIFTARPLLPHPCQENAAHPLTKAIVTVSSGRVQFYRSSINITPEVGKE